MPLRPQLKVCLLNNSRRDTSRRKGLVWRLADGNAGANDNAIRGRRKLRGSPCSITDCVEGCRAACSGVGSITHVRTGDSKR